MAHRQLHDDSKSNKNFAKTNTYPLDILDDTSLELTPAFRRFSIEYPTRFYLSNMVYRRR